MMNALNARVTDFAQDGGGVHFAGDISVGAEAAHLQCFKDFLSPLLPNCIYAAEDSRSSWRALSSVAQALIFSPFRRDTSPSVEIH